MFPASKTDPFDAGKHIIFNGISEYCHSKGEARRVSYKSCR
jgi:hypothetical protein